jgi:glc operon protein GlcG
MPSKPYIAIADADRVASAAREAAQAAGVAVTICVVDDAGHLLRLERLDGAPLVSLRVAEGKARTAVEMKMPTSLAEQAATGMPSIVAIADIYPFRGGFPLFEGDFCVGAVGISGGSPDQDEAIAVASACVWTPAG